MNNNKVEEIKASNPNGKTIVLSDDICAKWGFNGKAAQINQIGAALAEKGFDVKITHRPSNITGLFQVFAEIAGQNVLVYSNNEKDKADGVIIANYAKDAHQQIVDNILARFN